MICTIIESQILVHSELIFEKRQNDLIFVVLPNAQVTFKS